MAVVKSFGKIEKCPTTTETCIKCSEQVSSCEC